MLTERQKESLFRTGETAFSSITERIQALRQAEESGDYSLVEEARSVIEQVLSVEIRSGWVAALTLEGAEPEEYKILLATGGPGVRIVGDLDQGQPRSATLQVQVWLTPWTDHRCDEEILLEFASCFNFGE